MIQRHPLLLRLPQLRLPQQVRQASISLISLLPLQSQIRQRHKLLPFLHPSQDLPELISRLPQPQGQPLQVTSHINPAQCLQQVSQDKLPVSQDNQSPIIPVFPETPG